MRSKVLTAAAAALALSTAPAQALAWGAEGHRMIGVLATQALPAELPAFLRRASVDVGELSREPDRSRGAGKLHDTDRDAAHFVDIDDNGTALGGPTLATMPPLRSDYEKALQAAGENSWSAGYLPYAILDRYQQLTQEFAYWRVLRAAEGHRAWRANRAWFRADRIRREALILRTMGELSHFVGDGSQPLHVTSHYNGWGDGPNPEGFTKARIHSNFEGEFVAANVRAAAVRSAMPPPTAPTDQAIEGRVAIYLQTTNSFVAPLYALEKAGGFAAGDARGAEFVTGRMAVGAAALRDLVTLAWAQSLNNKVGWKPPVAVGDVVSGKINPYPVLYGTD
ncbi:S1/P1 Nuclease [Phenylobacterium immobile]|uniref:S1/P1 Nuclease n=1 Tax=Phenylobacterium immobile TaxID=21 RepID=UPI000AAFBF46|nr:S1/P1 Nuclease [Phenylobacterium immobile]